MLPFASPTRQLPAEGHEIAVRLAPAAMGMALDQFPAGPLVVDVVECVVVVGAPELDGDELQLRDGERDRSERDDRQCGADDVTPLPTTTAGPAGRSPRGPDGATTCRAR